MPEIQKELIGKRTANSKTFDLGNGKRQLVVSIGAIHYRDNYANKSEQWKDIDLTWEGNRITKAPYELTLVGKKLTLKNKKSGKVSTIELLDVKPAGLKFEILPEFSAVRFRHILPSDKVPFEAKFKVTGKIPFGTRASDDESELELETSLVDGILTEKLSQVKDKETGQVRPAKGSIRIDPTWQVGASSDDCRKYWNSSAWVFDLGNTYQNAGYYSDSYSKQGGGMRFTSITIPKETTITAAYLTFKCRLAGDGANCLSRISGWDGDDATIFSDIADFDTKYAAKTTAVVDWDNIEEWIVGNFYNSVSIVSVIQEIINRGGWTSGNALIIFWEDFDDRSTHASGNFRSGRACVVGEPTKLYINYEGAVDPPTVTTQAVDDILPTTATGNVTITDNGGENCSKRGICWSTSPNPTVANDKSEETDSFGTGAFERPMTGLLPGTHYYAKGYAYNSAGYGYGGQVEFDTEPEITEKFASDSGTGVDAKLSGNPVATISKGDSGSGTEALLARAFALEESGLGIEASLLLAGLLSTDSGTGIESIVSRAIALADLGTGTDISSLVVTLLKTDIGSGLDSSALEALITKAETGTGIEALEALAVALSKTDAGTGAEAILSRAFVLVDSGLGAEASVLLASLTAQDAAIASEIASLISTLTSSDSGVGLEAIRNRLFAALDTGTGSDVLISLGLLAADSGVGSEAVVSKLMALLDTGTGIEGITNLDIRRALRLIVLTSQLRQIKAQTSQYRKLKAITS